MAKMTTEEFLAQYKDEYVLVNPESGKYFAGWTKNGRRKHTFELSKAEIDTYDNLIGFCREAYYDYDICYQIEHISLHKDME